MTARPDTFELTQVKDFPAGGVILAGCGDDGIIGKAVSHSRTTGRSSRCASQ